jgi:diadenosine tetraphosphatase ApaH/serine/threonine PP2A family protein phosphatase
VGVVRVVSERALQGDREVFTVFPMCLWLYVRVDKGHVYFDCLSIACVLENKVFCVHAGLSPAIPAIDLIHEIDRRQEIPHEGPFSDLMWSDPEESVDAWSINQRGAGWLFGSKVVEKVRV